MYTNKFTPHLVSKTTLHTLCLLSLFLLLNNLPLSGKSVIGYIEHLLPDPQPVKYPAKKLNPDTPEPKPATRTDMTKGYWLSHNTKKYFCIEFKENMESYRWNISRCIDKTMFTEKQTDIFQVSRQTGTLTLSGKLNEDEGQGTYEFIADDTFKKHLADLSITSRDENFMFHLFLGDINKEYITFLKKNHSDINGDRLQELAIHGITQKRYQMYYDLFQKYSNKAPSIQEVVEARIHGLDQEHISQMESSGYQNLSMKKMIETKIHGVNAAYIEGLKKAGFDNLSIDKVVEAKIHGITPAAIKQIQSLGYTNLSLDKMIEVKIHGVNSSYIQELTDAGFSNLPINKLIEAKIHGVDADFIAQAKRKGHEPDNIDGYIELKIHGFDRNRNQN